MHKAAQTYLQTQVTTTNRGELLLMLYDGAIKFLSQAKESIKEKDFAQKGILISKAVDILAELTGSLNKERGGELAENLSSLYFYCNSRLLMANLKMDTAILDEVIAILQGLKDAYSQIISEGAAASAATQPARATQASPGLANATLSGHSPAQGPATAQARKRVMAAYAGSQK